MNVDTAIPSSTLVQHHTNHQIQAHVLKLCNHSMVGVEKSKSIRDFPPASN